MEFWKQRQQQLSLLACLLGIYQLYGHASGGYYICFVPFEDPFYGGGVVHVSESKVLQFLSFVKLCSKETTKIKTKRKREKKNIKTLFLKFKVSEERFSSPSLFPLTLNSKMKEVVHMLLAGLFFVAACLGVLLGNLVSPFIPLLFGPLAPLACIVYPPAMVVTNVLMIPVVGAVTFVGGLGDLAVVGLGLGGLAALLGGLGLGGLAALNSK